MSWRSRLRWPTEEVTCVSGDGPDRGEHDLSRGVCVWAGPAGARPDSGDGGRGSQGRSGAHGLLARLSRTVTSCVNQGGEIAVCRCRYPDAGRALREGYEKVVKEHPAWNDLL